MPQTKPHGVLLVDKPIGMTSFDVIRQLRRLLKTKKIGHAGTLDPFASGLLVVCVGNYTRFAGYLTDDDKMYRATLQLGVETNTDDIEGEAIHNAPVPHDWDQSLLQILPRFRGEISQIPPAFSAIHIDGERAYKRARKGETLEMPVRNVTIHALDIVESHDTTCVIDVVASKGTYIRALGRDLGRAIGCGAHLSALRRLTSGPFRIEEAFTPEALQETVEQGQSIPLLQNADALRDFTPILLDDDAWQRIKDGKTLQPPSQYDKGVYAAYTQTTKKLVGLVEIVAQNQTVDENATENDATANDSPDARVLKVKRLLPTD